MCTTLEILGKPKVTLLIGCDAQSICYLKRMSNPASHQTGVTDALNTVIHKVPSGHRLMCNCLSGKDRETLSLLHKNIRMQRTIRDVAFISVVIFYTVSQICQKVKLNVN